MDQNNDQILDPQTRSELPLEPQQPETNWKQFFKERAVVFYAIGAVLLVCLLGWYFMFAKEKAPDVVSSNVILQIKGPDQLVSGNEAEYKIIYRNGENADLTNITLEVFYPIGFKFKSSEPTANSTAGNVYNLPIVKEGNSGEVIVRGKMTGGTGENKQIKALLHYRLSNFNSEFAVDQTITTNILPPNLTMEINGPVDVVNGQDTTYSITLTNVTNQDYDNLALSLTYPEGFSYVSSTVPVTKNNNYWKLPKLLANSSTSMDVTGSFTGTNSETKLVKADLGLLVNNVFAPQLVATATFHLIASPLAIVLTSDSKDGNVSLGKTIDYTINYSNQGSIGMNNLIITVNLEGVALDISGIKADDAIVSGKTLTWKAATLPGLNVLSPNERGEINFSVPVTDNLTANIKNQTIKATAQVIANEISKPTKAADVVLKLSSDLDLIVRGEYVSGAAPLTVGKSTTFAMTFLLSNGSNDLSNTKVVASLPLPSSAWKNVIIPDVEKNRLSYDPNSGKITWNIGDVPAFVGKFIPVLKVTFNLEVNPTEVDRNKSMNLLSNVIANGKDTFTSLSVEAKEPNDVTTTSIDDDVLESRGGGTVK